MTLAIISLIIILVLFTYALCKASSRDRDDTEQEEVLSRRRMIMKKITINLTDNEIKQFGDLIGIEIKDEADMEYCIKAVIETFG